MKLHAVTTDGMQVVQVFRMILRKTKNLKSCRNHKLLREKFALEGFPKGCTCKPTLQCHLVTDKGCSGKPGFLGSNPAQLGLCEAMEL